MKSIKKILRDGRRVYRVQDPVTSGKVIVSYSKIIFRSKLALYNLGIRPNYEKKILRKTAFESKSVRKP